MQPVPFTISISFANDETNGVSGRSTVKTSSLDGLMAAIQTTFTQILANIALIQRDDGALLDATVRIHTLSAEVLALLSSTAWKVRGAWVGGTAYAKGDVVLQGGIVYVCIVAHTAGVFATDLAAGDWGQVTANGTASATSFAPTLTIAATNVQAAVSELDNEIRPTVSLLNRDLYNGL